MLSVIVEEGSIKENLQDLELSMFTVCLTNNISQSVGCIPRTENDRADHISCIIDHDDWGISQNLFYYIDALWAVFYSRFQLIGMVLMDGLCRLFVL